MPARAWRAVLSLRRRILPIAGTAVGLALFGYAVGEAGVAEIVEGVRRVGWGVAAILALAGVRFMLRAQCWRLCMPAHTRIPFDDAFRAFLAGDAVGNLLPLGPAASEPTKVLLTRHQLPTDDAISSLTIDNLIYLATVITVVAGGVATLAIDGRLPFEFRHVIAAGVVLVAAAAVLVAWVIQNPSPPAGGRATVLWMRLQALRGSIRHFAVHNRLQAVKVYGVHLAFHAVSVFEHYITLGWLIGDAGATLGQAVVFEALNRVLTVAFKFIPFRVGVDEVASAELAAILGLAPVVGVTSAVLRKVRNLFWSGVGVALIAARRAPAAPATDRP